MKNHYELLDVNPKASIDAIRVMYDLKIKIAGDDKTENGKFQMWALKEAYETLCNPVKRRAYDEKISSTSSEVKLIQRNEVRPPPEISWKVSAILIALIVMGVVGYGLNLNSKTEKNIQENSALKINKDAEINSGLVSNQKELVQGVVSNQKALVQGVVKVEEKRIDAESNYLNQVESRNRQELEYRANAGQQVLELERERQRAIIALEEQRAENTRKQREIEIAAKERAYWSCMNASMNRMNGADAGLYCSRYRQ